MKPVILDISRLISRVRYSTPTGVDRVEMAYARGLLRHYGTSVDFAAIHPIGVYGRINRDVALTYLDELEGRWTMDQAGPSQRSIASIIPWMVRLLPGAARHARPDTRPVYVQVSPHHLTDGAKVQKMLKQEGARFLCMVHDLIPIEYPEYARPGGAELHRRRMETVVGSADAIIVNSAATGRSLAPWIERSGRHVPVHVALLGTEALSLPTMPGPPPDKPYFVCIGTIEGRKNHLLLLHLWRRMAQTMPDAQIPRLVIIGRRGWENEQVLDLLDRCPNLAGHVEEVSGCPDLQLTALLCGARALLMPSFAEGYGMPVAEALSLGIPVICSDIPAHREVGGTAPDYIDPLDGAAWQAMVLDHARGGPAHAAQLERLPFWEKPCWDTHMGIVKQAIESLSQTD